MGTNINHFIEKIKFLLHSNREEVLICLVVFLVGSASFVAGRLSGMEPLDPYIEFRESNMGTETLSALPEVTSGDNQLDSNEKIVASKNGKAYYFENCPGVSRISEKNKIYFTSVAAAVGAGYYQAANCNK